MKNFQLVFIGILSLCLTDVFGQQSADSITIKKDSVTAQNVDRFVNNPDAERVVEVTKLDVKEVVVLPETKSMSKGEKTALTLKIPEAQVKNVQKNWEKYIRNKTKSKIQKALDETSIQATNIGAIYQEPINVYSKLVQTPEGVNVSAFFEIDSAFITTSDEDKLTAASEYLRKFGIQEYKLATEDQLRNEEKILKTMRQKLTKLQKENEKMHKNIKENESNIVNTESDITINLSDQVRKATEVENQKVATANTASATKEEQKAAKKALKDREKEKKKLQKKNQDMHKSIAKYKAEIEQTRRAIQLNLDQQSVQNAAIKKQMAFIRGVESKLLQIK